MGVNGSIGAVCSAAHLMTRVVSQVDQLCAHITDLLREPAARCIERCIATARSSLKKLLCFVDHVMHASCQIGR